MPLKGCLTAIENQKIVAELTEGLLIKVLVTEIKRNTIFLATFIRNSNIKFKKDKSPRRNLSSCNL